MKFILQRDELDGDVVSYVTGTLTAPGFSCLTLERLAVLCPAGVYRLERQLMVTHKVYRAKIVDVPGHSGVFIHSGNHAYESKMCPLVGDSRPTPDTLAGGTSHGIADKIASLVAEHVTCDIEILGAPKVIA
jgi:hypothetical protein